MGLVEKALEKPSPNRKAYLRETCGDNSELFDRVWHYIEWEERMQGFLLDPLYPQTSEPAFSPGELLDKRFRIVREVARGGMGIVYEAMDEKLERRIALKCAKAGFHKRLPPEVRNASEISHPNVCKIFEIHTATTAEGEIDFITMEFLEGETLSERLHRGISEKEARVIAQQILAGVAEAHRNKVVHGDLKSSNVILTSNPDGTVRSVITDFGLARRPEGPLLSLESDLGGGTPAYMAPELWEGQQVSLASDVYALGVILQELALGHLPQGTDTTAVAWDRPRQVYERPAGLPRKWERIINRCLQPDPRARFRDASEVAQELYPSRALKWVLVGVAAVALAVLSAGLVYQQATAPKEAVSLAILPFELNAEAAPFADELKDAEEQLIRLKSSARTRITVIPVSRTISEHVTTAEKARTVFGATHVLHGRADKEGTNLTVRIYLTDARSQTHGEEWKAEYSQDEMRYVPVALAGVVTGSLRLPPLTVPSDVNATAHDDYANGLWLIRRDAGMDSALDSFEKAVIKDPASPLVYAGRAEAEWFKYYFSKDPSWLARANDSVYQAIRRNPDAAPVYRISGLLKSNAGLYQPAIADYLRAIELDPKNSDAHRRLGAVYENNHQLELALTEYLRAVEIEPGYYRNQQQLGAYYYQRADYENAVIQFLKTVALEPNEPNPRFALSNAYMNLGRFTQAESELRRSIALKETPSAAQMLGVTLMYENKDQEAITYLLRALELRPQSALTLMYLSIAYRRAGMTSESDEANRRGLKLADEDLQRDPASGYVRCLVGYFSAALGDDKRAKSEIEQGLKQSPNDADTIWRAILTYEVLRHRDSTLRVLDSAPATIIADLSRWPDVADLQKDSRFIALLESHHIK